ncbi:MAG TPA: glycosyltransferase family 1 protein, partial [Gemmatimonadales bacterium]|nr:glycosyltransferase family 1 protein [Gemmatimonadales bacterium]
WARKQAWPAVYRLAPFWEPWLRPRRADLFHGLNQRLPEAPYPARVVTIHDLFPLTSRDYSTREFQSRFAAILRRAIARADRIIAVSDATRQQLLRHTDARDGRIRVVHHGVDPARPVAPAEQEDFRQRVLGLNRQERFFLNVGAVQNRKNIGNIALALRRLPEFRLVLAGGDGFGAEAIYTLIEKEGLAGRILRLGHAPPETLRLLYSTAAALVFPSLEEGFGLPVLEAMSYGLPVITSNCSAMPEVAGDAALLVDPLDVAALSEAMRRVAEDENLAASLRRRGFERASAFPWEKCASQTWKVYQEALEEKQ